MNARITITIIILACFPVGLCADECKLNTPVSMETIAAYTNGPDTGDTELVVMGKLNSISPARFNLCMLKRMKPTSFQIDNHWTGVSQKYTGVAFIDLLRQLGLDESASTATVVAANDYRIAIKLSDLKRYEYVLSYALDDKDYAEHEPSNNKGPIAVAINFGKHPELDWDVYKHQLVWFVTTIIVE